MKKSIFGFVGVFFVLLGIILLIAPQISNQIGKQEALSVINEFETLKENISFEEKPTEGNSAPEEKSEEKQENSNNEKAQPIIYKVDIDRLRLDCIAYNKSLIKNQVTLLNEVSYQQPSFNLQDYGIYNGVFGYVSAPSINMKLPIYLGASEYNMSCGAAHLTYTSLPIGENDSNCVLSGHTGYIGRIFFDYIRNLQKGDTVEITNYWDKLSYEVVDMKINKKYQSSDCYITEGKDLLTLITCISDGMGGFDRYYVICERK